MNLDIGSNTKINSDVTSYLKMYVMKGTFELLALTYPLTF